uniref:Ribonuclease HII n=1 Tax=Bursaphelenchus xylophilus TaxID=6326 RepID=A0A1I7SIZ5_BURXY
PIPEAFGLGQPCTDHREILQCAWIRREK